MADEYSGIPILSGLFNKETRSDLARLAGGINLFRKIRCSDQPEAPLLGWLLPQMSALV